MSSTTASISDKTELWWRESQDLVAPFASAIAEATQNAWRDGYKHGHAVAIHEMRLVLAVIEAFEALRGSMGVCLGCGTHTRCTANARHGFGVCHRCEARYKP